MIVISEAVLSIDYANLKYNVEWMKTRTTNSFFCPMVKANAYGAGAVLVSQALIQMGVNKLGVARLSEAIELREAGIEADILLFNHFTEEELALGQELNLTFVVSSMQQLELFNSFCKKLENQDLNMHLEFDTGMSRLGFSLQELDALREYIDKNNLQVQGVFTHFLEAINWPETGKSSQKQTEEFLKITQKFPESVAHIASSKALAGGEKKWQYGVRPGVWLYGVDSANTHLKPALRLTAPIISLRTISAGQSVSYGGVWVASRPTKIATLPIGYGDGYSRTLTGQTEVLVKGKKAPVVGAICMDYMMVDVTDVDQSLELGEEVLIFGEDQVSGQEISIESLAQKCNVIAYEFIVGLSQRLRRQIVGGPPGNFTLY